MKPTTKWMKAKTVENLQRRDDQHKCNHFYVSWHERTRNSIHVRDGPTQKLNHKAAKMDCHSDKSLTADLFDSSLRDR